MPKTAACSPVRSRAPLRRCLCRRRAERRHQPSPPRPRRPSSAGATCSRTSATILAADGGRRSAASSPGAGGVVTGVTGTVGGVVGGVQDTVTRRGRRQHLGSSSAAPAARSSGPATRCSARCQQRPHAACRRRPSPVREPDQRLGLVITNSAAAERHARRRRSANSGRRSCAPARDAPAASCSTRASATLDGHESSPPGGRHDRRRCAWRSRPTSPASSPVGGKLRARCAGRADGRKAKAAYRPSIRASHQGRRQIVLGYRKASMLTATDPSCRAAAPARRSGRRTTMTPSVQVRSRRDRSPWQKRLVPATTITASRQQRAGRTGMREPGGPGRRCATAAPQLRRDLRRRWPSRRRRASASSRCRRAGSRCRRSPTPSSA